MVMPVFCLALFTLASMARQTRSSMLEVVRQDVYSNSLGERVARESYCNETCYQKWIDSSNYYAWNPGTNSFRRFRPYRDGF